MAVILENTVIHLLGAPGTGKYTVAQELVQLGKAAGAEMRLVDNHLINNPVFSLLRLDGKTKLPEGVWDNIGLIWDAVADTMKRLAPKEFNFILTNALFEHDADDRQHMTEMAAVAAARGGRYVPVRLVLKDVAEHTRRITAADRNARMKETNAEAPARYAEKTVLLTGLPAELTLDTTALTAREAAGIILSHIQALPLP